MTRTFTVPILLPADPTADLEAATKQYVDTASGGAAGSVQAFTFNSSTSEPPTGNQIRFNNSTQSSATVMWISQTTFEGLDVSVGFSRITAGYQIYIQDFDDASAWILLNVTGAGTDEGSYWEFPITYNAGPGIPTQKVAAQYITPANHGIPSGGADGDVLTKTSSSNYAVAWEAPPGAAGGLDAEGVMDLLGTTGLVEGTGVTLTYDDTGGTLTIDAAGGGITTEDAVDAVATALTEGTGITITYDDGANTITLDADAAATGTKVTALTALTGASTSGDDLVEVVDVSDTTMAGSGTNKKMTLDELIVALGANGAVLDADITGLLASATAATTYAPIRRSVINETGTTFAPVVATHENTYVTLSNASAITVTVPSNATSAFPIGAEVDFLWLGVGQPTFAAGGSATLQPSTTLKLRARYSAATIKKIATNDWILMGDISA